MADEVKGVEGRRCSYCARPYLVSDAVFEENPHCAKCLYERVGVAHDGMGRVRQSVNTWTKFDGNMLEWPGGGMNLAMLRALLLSQGLHIVGEAEYELLSAWHALPGGDDDEGFSEETINAAAARWDKAIDAVKVARRASKGK